MLEKLRNLNVERMDLDEAVALATIGRATASGYAYYNVPAPQWLNAAIDTLDAEIKSRRRDMLLARQKEIDASLTNLKTREERKSDLEAEAAALREQLASA